MFLVAFCRHAGLLYPYSALGVRGGGGGGGGTKSPN